MTWIAGTSRAGYDYVGPWEKRITIDVNVPDAIHGDADMPGEAIPGTFCLGGGYKALRLVVEVES